MNNKKGEADTWIVVSKWSYYVIGIFILSIGILVFIGKGISFIDAKTAVSPELREDLIISRLTNVCFAFEDYSTGRVYQNALDLNKLNEIILDFCVPSLDISVTVSSLDGSFESKSMSIGKATRRESYLIYTLVKKDDEFLPASMLVII